MRVGVVGSQVDGDTYEGFNKAGITAGLFVNRKLSDLFSLQLEMNYIQKGSRKPLDDNNTYYLMRVTYIEVPVLLQWHAGKLIDILPDLHLVYSLILMRKLISVNLKVLTLKK